MVGAAVAEADAEAQQPDAERGVRRGRTIAPGRAVVDDDPFRQAVTTECRLKMPLHRLALLVATGRQAQVEARAVVQHGQRMAAARGQGKMALEVHLPELVRPRPLEALKRRGRPCLPQGNAMAPQDRRHRRWRRHARLSQIRQPPGDLAPAPARMIRTHRQNRGFHRLRRAARTGPWPSRTVREIRRAGPDTAQPLVARLAADAETAAQRRDIRTRLTRQHHKLQTQVHYRHLRPGHRAAPLLNNPRSNVSPMSPNRCYPSPKSIHDPGEGINRLGTRIRRRRGPRGPVPARCAAATSRAGPAGGSGRGPRGPRTHPGRVGSHGCC